MLKSPIYRTGNKSKNMPKIKKILPLEIDNFYDVFGGSGVVGINSGAKKVHYNELSEEVFRLMEWLKQVDYQEQLLKYEKLFDNYNFNMFSSEEKIKKEEKAKELYLKIRKKYNETKKEEDLYFLTCSSFSNGMRFNSKNEFTMPFGKSFRVKSILEAKNLKKITSISNLDFEVFLKDKKFTKNDIVFFDPPYLNSEEATNKDIYNNNWSSKEEKRLFVAIKKLNENKIKIVITNTLENKGNKNKFVEKIINDLNFNYKILNENNNSFGQMNSNYIEVVLYNFEEKQTYLF